jgi:hypothetical protein
LINARASFNRSLANSTCSAGSFGETAARICSTPRFTPYNESPGSEVLEANTVPLVMMTINASASANDNAP